MYALLTRTIVLKNRSEDLLEYYAQLMIRYKNIGSGALPGKILLVGIIENNKVEAYFRSG